MQLRFEPLPHPHLFDRERCLAFGSKTIIKFRKAKENYFLAGTSSEQLSSGLGCSSLLHSEPLEGAMERCVCCEVTCLALDSCSITHQIFRSKPRLYRTCADSGFRCLQSAFHKPWLRGDVAVTLMKVKLPGASHAGAPSRALGGALPSFIHFYSLRGLQNFAYTQVPQNIDPLLLWPI